MRFVIGLVVGLVLAPILLAVAGSLGFLPVSATATPPLVGKPRRRAGRPESPARGEGKLDAEAAGGSGRKLT